MNESPLCLSVEQARKKLQVSRTLLYSLIHSGHVPAIRLGKRLLIPVSGLELMLKGEKEQILNTDSISGSGKREA